MTIKLPSAWVRDEVASVREDVAPYLGLDLAERARILAAVCLGAAQTLRARDDRERVIAYRDPLPASTVAALARLRAEARRGRQS